MRTLLNLKIFFIGIFMMINSCSLEEIVPDTVMAKSIKTESDVQSVINGVYAPLNNAEGFKYSGAFLFLFLSGDDIFASASGEINTWSDKSFGSLHTHTFWNVLYSVIGNANNLIDVLDRLELSEKFEKRAYGDAYFMRAFAYYYLVRFFGGVPLRNKVTTINSDFTMPRKTVAEVYAQIFSDFEEAYKRLPQRKDIPESEIGRATKGAAQGLLAQAYLTYANHLDREGNKTEANNLYQKSVNYCDSVINSGQYALLRDYGQLWSQSSEIAAYEEVMFGVRFSPDPMRAGYGASGSEYAYRFGAGSAWHITGNKPNGNGGTDARVQPWFAVFYHSGDYGDGSPEYGKPDHDYRAEKSYFQRGQNYNLNPITNQNFRTFYSYPVLPPNRYNVEGFSTSVTPLVGKYIDPAGYDSRNHGNDFYVMRYAEILLIKSEALNELQGPQQTSIELINEVRTRARHANGTPRTYPTLLTLGSFTKETLRRKLLEERGAEFLAEGLRWFDLVRMTSHLDPTKTMYDYQFGTFLQTLPVGNPTFQNTNHRWAGTLAGVSTTGVARASITYDPKFKLFPIPTTELINNPDFGEQNPGW